MLNKLLASLAHLSIIQASITYSPSMHKAHRFEDNSLVVRYAAAYIKQLIEDCMFYACLCKKADKLLHR